MKKLLVLFVMMLVVGLVFAGPVHINGPGDVARDSAEFHFTELFGKADTALPSIQGAVIGSDVVCIFAGNSQGVFNYNEYFGCTDTPMTLLAITTAALDSVYANETGKY
jgi:hypothetical protein